ncbi:alpha/beta hydrolase [Streptomyces sp. NPDC006339]|uniref:alpha/beta hydrolase n=1 Tax=Streptomyces sp. NPDC006339 TaxID=3156755 RepID=UPI0033B0F938
MSGTALTWRQLRDLRLAEFEQAGDAWHQVSGRADADRVRVDRAMSAKLRETQCSESAEAALARLRRLSRNFQYLHTECGLARTALNGLAGDLAEPQRQVKLALEEARALRFTVHEDGSVAYPAAPVRTAFGDQEAPGGLARVRLLRDPSPFADATPLGPLNPHAEKAQDIADRIGRAVLAAASIDARYARTLDALRAAGGLDVTEATLRDVARDTAAVRDTAGHHLAAAVPKDGSPAARKAWWDALPEEQRREYLDIAPDLIGNLDGIPAAVRDEANRRYLPLLIAELERTGGGDAETKLEALRKIQATLARPSDPPMLLLGIGTEGNGRAIVAYGDPDTSRNVSAYVPGLGTKLDAGFVDDTMVRAQDTAKGARSVDPSSAAIVWLGYDAPQHGDVMLTGDAERGAPAYNRFMAGLSATNAHPDPHVTAIGHSYGSLTVGTAARQSGGIPGVDDVILLGSPGVGVDRAEDLGVSKEHVFVGAADNDPVTHLPSKTESAVGMHLGGSTGVLVARDLLDRGNDDVYFGKDPASEAFGARRFEVDDGPRMVVEGGLFQAHSQYFTPDVDAESANNIALIVGGSSHRISKEEHR